MFFPRGIDGLVSGVKHKFFSGCDSNKLTGKLFKILTPVLFLIIISRGLMAPTISEYVIINL